MNKPTRIDPAIVDEDIGPLDENGQQIWSPEEAAAIERLHQDPEYIAGCERADAQDAAGELIDHDVAMARFAEFRRNWLAARGL